MLPQKPKGAPIGGRTEYECKVYPNGEAVVWRPRRVKLDAPLPRRSRSEAERQGAIARLAFSCPEVLQAAGVHMGLSILANFDSLSNRALREADQAEPGIINFSGSHAVTGSRGITAFGRRMVRNGAHLLEKRAGIGRCVFATATVPDLPLEQMRLLHERWNKVVEIYRLGLTRMLQRQNLSGESVSVTEIQEKRYERTGIPVLHVHTVFCGKTATGQWAITTEDHDRIWANALKVALQVEHIELTSACNLQRVKKSTEGYLGKYMTKGVKVVHEVISQGFGRWLPKQWWNMSRVLRQRIDRETRMPHQLACWLYEAAGSDGSNVWDYHREISLELDNGRTMIIAKYGRLSKRTVAEIQGYYDSA